MKEYKLLLRDVGFSITGRADVSPAPWNKDSWLYPLDWTYQLDRESDYFDPKDQAGVPLRDYPGALGRQYLISRIAGYALAHWNRWRTSGFEANQHAFLRIVDAFPAAVNGRYEHHFPVAGMRVPWISCISQGEAASVFCRAFTETGNDNYLCRAMASLEPLMIPVEQGGLLSRLPDGRPFLEEYPGTVYRHVLNGCLYASVGIHDVIRASAGRNPAHTLLFRNVIDAIGCHIDAWDLDGWSTYDFPFAADVPRNVNTMTYQVLQSALLKYLAEASGDQRLLSMGERWEKSMRRLDKRVGALCRKIRYRMAVKW